MTLAAYGQAVMKLVLRGLEANTSVHKWSTAASRL